jgi:hypothetical protein
MLIHLNENIFHKLFLTESKNSKRAHYKTRELIAQHLSKRFDDIEENDFNHPDVINFEKHLEKTFFGEGKNKDWFIVLEPNVYMWFNECKSYKAVGRCVDYLFIKATKFDKPSEFINSIRQITSYDEISKFVEENIQKDRDIAKKQMENMDVKLNQNYQVLGPLTREQSKVYGDYSGLDNGTGGGRICYTQHESLWLSPNYSDRERNECYLLLRNDWKEVKAVHDGSEKNNNIPEINLYNAYDDYGLSMIFVWITPEGELHECNTRWNHEANYAPGHSIDKALNEVDIANLLGAPFDKVFKIEHKKKLSIEEYRNLPLKEKTKYLESLLRKMDRHELGHSFYKTMFDECDSRMGNIYAIVKLDGYYNIINTLNPRIELDFWCDGVKESYCGTYIITKDNRQTFYIDIRNRLKLGTDLWLDKICGFEPDSKLSIVIRNGQYNLMNVNGDFLFKNSYDFIGKVWPNSKVYIVGFNGKKRLINAMTMDYISDEYDDIKIASRLYENSIVILNGKYNFLCTFELRSGKFIKPLFDMWFDKIIEKEYGREYFGLCGNQAYVISGGKIYPTSLSNFNENKLQI